METIMCTKAQGYENILAKTSNQICLRCTELKDSSVSYIFLCLQNLGYNK